MNELEKRIIELSPQIKSATLRAIRIGKPFQYMINLSKVGDRDYGVPFKDSFWFGVDKSLDWFNAHKKYSNNLSTEFYALKQGAEWIMRYCYYNMEPQEDESEEQAPE